MSETERKVGHALRLIASEGWAERDPVVVAELLDGAHLLATAVLADNGASDELRAKAQDFLDRLSSDLD